MGVHPQGRRRRTDLYAAATQTARTCRNAHPCPPSWAQDGRTLHDTLPPLYTDLRHCIIPCPPFLAGRAPNMHGAVRPRTAATCCTMSAPPRLSPPLAEHKPRCGTDFDSHTTVATTQRAPNRKLPQCIRGIRLQRRITASHRHTDVHAHTLPHQHAHRRTDVRRHVHAAATVHAWCGGVRARFNKFIFGLTH